MRDSENFVFIVVADIVRLHHVSVPPWNCHSKDRLASIEYSFFTEPLELLLLFLICHDPNIQKVIETLRRCMSGGIKGVRLSPLDNCICFIRCHQPPSGVIPDACRAILGLRRAIRLTPATFATATKGKKEKEKRHGRGDKDLWNPCHVFYRGQGLSPIFFLFIS